MKKTLANRGLQQWRGFGADTRGLGIFINFET